jgi:hypothetical protein
MCKVRLSVDVVSREMAIEIRMFEGNLLEYVESGWGREDIPKSASIECLK